MTLQKVPFLDLITPHRELREELREVFERVMDNAGFIGGPMVEQFEQEFAVFCGSRFCVGVGSGTDALRLALVACGVHAGDTVVTVPLTFIATAEAISQAGARPDFIDVDPNTCTMDPEQLRVYFESRCTWNKTSGRLLNNVTGLPVTAVIPVHLYGQTADMDPIIDLAERYNVVVIEDACQAHDAEYFSRKDTRWRKAGSMGRAAAFSFYPGKNLGACGEAGAVTTDSEHVAQRCRMLRDHGQSQKYFHDTEGYNARLDAIQAGILRAKLRYLPEWNERRRQVAQRYNELFRDLTNQVRVPFEPAWSKSSYHLYPIRTTGRDELQAHLAESGIGTGIHYPIPLHLQKAYEQLGFKRGCLPVSEKLAQEVLSLPMYPTLAISQQHEVVNSVYDFVAGRLLAAAGPRSVSEI